MMDICSTFIQWFNEYQSNRLHLDLLYYKSVYVKLKKNKKYKYKKYGKLKKLKFYEIELRLA